MNEHNANTENGTAGNPCPRGRRRHRGFGAVTLLLVGGLAGAGVATAVGVAAHADRAFGGGHGGATMMFDGGHGGRDHGMRGGQHGERMKDRVAWVLGAVDATPEQRDHVQAKLDELFAQMQAMRGERGELRRQLVTELAGSDIDRAELERIRGEFVAGMETRSRAMVDTVASIAETLTPEQRATIAEHMASRGPRR